MSAIRMPSVEAEMHFRELSFSLNAYAQILETKLAQEKAIENAEVALLQAINVVRPFLLQAFCKYFELANANLIAVELIRASGDRRKGIFQLIITENRPLAIGWEKLKESETWNNIQRIIVEIFGQFGIRIQMEGSGLFEMPGNTKRWRNLESFSIVAIDRGSDQVN